MPVRLGSRLEWRLGVVFSPFVSPRINGIPDEIDPLAHIPLQSQRLGRSIGSTPRGNTMRHLISSGSSFEHDVGYSRAVVEGDWVFVSGTTGFDYATMTIANDVAAQTEQALANIALALREADATFADVVRVRYILPTAEDFPACWPALRGAFGEARPASTMIEAGLIDKRIKIEIEVTARKGSEDR